MGNYVAASYVDNGIRICGKSLGKSKGKKSNLTSVNVIKISEM